MYLYMAYTKKNSAVIEANLPRAASLSHSPLPWSLPAITKMTLRKAHPEIPWILRD